MNEISITYVDDIPDEILSRFMSKTYCSQQYSNEKIKKIYSEVRFDGEKGYESLLQDTRVRSANVVLVDNRLFEERNADAGKFSGKQFKVILRKLLPFVEVIIITQDEKLIGDNIIHKFSGRNNENPEEYYTEMLTPILDSAISEVLEFNDLAADLRVSADVEKTLIEKILQSLQGDNSYDQLTKADIDSLIDSFKELKDSCGY